MTRHEDLARALHVFLDLLKPQIQLVVVLGDAEVYPMDADGIEGLIKTFVPKYCAEVRGPDDGELDPHRDNPRGSGPEMESA